jgi:hypothetical protein
VLATVTDTADEVAVCAVESVNRAVNEYVPAVAGVHATVYGAVNTGPPIAIPFAKKATLVTVAPGDAAAEAVTVTGVPTVPVLLLAGVLSETAAEVTAVTLAPVEVTELPFVSVTRAVSV